MDMDKAATSPIVVDLDGTLTATDTLIESLVKLVKQSPATLLQIPFWLLGGRAGFKDQVAARVRLAADRLPYNAPLLAYLRDQKSDGRSLVLATAAHVSIAQDVSAHLGLFDAVLASDGERNLKGRAKLKAIQERF